MIEDPSMRGSAVPHTEQLLEHYYDWWTAKKPFRPSSSRPPSSGYGATSTPDSGRRPWFTPTPHFTTYSSMSAQRMSPGLEFAHSAMLPKISHRAGRRWNGSCPGRIFWRNIILTEDSASRISSWTTLRSGGHCETPFFAAVLHSLIHGEADDIDPVTIALSTFARLQADLAKSLSRITLRA